MKQQVVSVLAVTAMRKGLSERPGQECTEAERFGGDMVWEQRRGTGPPPHGVDARGRGAGAVLRLLGAAIKARKSRTGSERYC